MRAVVDTNVLVSGLLSPEGPPGMTINMIAGGDIHICYDARMLAEYRTVLFRPDFNLSARSLDELLDQIITSGEAIQAAPLFSRLPDRRDEPFLEVAVAGKVACLITGNRKHFPLSACHEVMVFTPSEVLEYYRGQHDRRGDRVKSPSEKYQSSRRTPRKNPSKSHGRQR